MVKRWLQYLAVWVSCLVFYFAYRQWMAWLILVSVSALPVFSLVVSLPAMLGSRITANIPEAVTVGREAILDISLECPLPAPIWRLRITARHSLTGESCRLQPGNLCPTEHCGAVDFKFTHCRVYDFLGLFFLPKKLPTSTRLLVRPVAQKTAVLPDLSQWQAARWQPKQGGGFAENHELRLYRPGDSLRHIHWKASGKTGKLIYREPMELADNRPVLRISLSGSPEELDRKLGRLLWLGRYLLRQGLCFYMLADTAPGQQRWAVASGNEFRRAMDTLLGCAPLEQGPEPVLPAGQWLIGGDADEAQ